MLQEVKLESGSAILVHRHGDFYVTSPACSHYGAPLRKGVSSAGGRGGAPTVTCPLHDATFDLRTGQVVRGSYRRDQNFVESQILKVAERY